MPRAYSPRLTTVWLAGDIRRRPGVSKVSIIPPRRSVPIRPTLLRVTLEPQGMNPKEVYTDFTIPEARAWLECEKVMEREGRQCSRPSEHAKERTA
jgi:hypothetical protein